MIKILRSLSRLGFRKGMGGGGRAWIALGALTWFAARAREKSRKDSPPLHR